MPVPAAAGRELPALASQLPDVRARIAAARERAAAPTYGVVSVTALARKEGPRAPSPAEEARGAAWGRVLHQLLEAAMRSPQTALEPLAENLLREEEVAPDLLGEVLRVAASVTASDLWARALKASRRYVEVPFEMVVPSKDLGIAGGPAETLLKGAMDLVFEEDGVWHIVDWKSDVVGDGLPGLVAHYAPQATHYRRAWEALTKRPARAGLFFMDTGELVWLGEENAERKTEEKISLKVHAGQGEGGRPAGLAVRRMRKAALLLALVTAGCASSPWSNTESVPGGKLYVPKLYAPLLPGSIYPDRKAPVPAKARPAVILVCPVKGDCREKVILDQAAQRGFVVLVTRAAEADDRPRAEVDMARTGTVIVTPASLKVEVPQGRPWRHPPPEDGASPSSLLRTPSLRR